MLEVAWGCLKLLEIVWGCLGLVRVDWANSMCGLRAGLGVLWGWLEVVWGCLGWFGSIGQILCAACGLAWGCFGAGLVVPWCWLWCGCVLCRDYVPTFPRVLGWRGLCGGIATIGAALRRVAGVSGVYGRKTPRVVAQRAVHLGDMRVTWGVWGVVDYGLGALVRGEAFSAGRRVGYVGPQYVLPG